ncbi:hypothetical protein Tco_1214209 [Tanacetum coccineum]
MERGFLSQKGSGIGRGVKEKDLNRNKKNTYSGISVSIDSDDTMNDDTPIGVAFAIQEDVTPYVVDMTVEIEKQNSLEDTTVLESFPPLSILVIATAGNAPGKSLYANVTSKPSGKKFNFHTLFTPRGNGIDVVVPVKSIHAISERFANAAYGFFLGKRVAYPVVANYDRNTWGKYGLLHSMFSSSTRIFSFQFSSMDGLDAMLENGPCEDGLSAIATKLGNPLMFDSYSADICMQSWGQSSYARAMIKLRADVELKDNIVVVMPKVAGEGHYTCNVHVEYEWKPPRLGFKPHKEHRPVLKKPNASSSSNKKKSVEPTIEVSNSNPFDVLISVDNDVELGTNGGTTNLVNNEANSSGSSFMNVNNSSTSTTPIIDKIKKFKDLLSSGKAILMDNAGNPLKKVELLGDYDSEDEVASVDNDRAHSLASERVDPYDDDMYKGQDVSQEIQAICDNLDIKVRGRKKK